LVTIGFQLAQAVLEPREFCRLPFFCRTSGVAPIQCAFDPCRDVINELAAGAEFGGQMTDRAVVLTKAPIAAEDFQPVIQGNISAGERTRRVVRN
jgi:hypothetical protein